MITFHGKMKNVKWHLLFLLFIGCNSDLQPCTNREKPHKELGVRHLGDVVLDGETCKVDEIFNVYWNGDRWNSYPVDIDEEHQCLLSWRVDGATVARRITCPSGKNSSNLVKDDGTKFHDEVLE